MPRRIRFHTPPKIKKLKTDHGAIVVDMRKQYDFHLGNRKVRVPRDVVNVKIHSGITEIYYKTFDDCQNLKTISIPNSVKFIGVWSFFGCSSLSSIVIPNSVTNISGAFNCCTSLTSIVIPKSVRNVRSAFHGCTSLICISIPESIISIEDAFYECTSLSSIVIPNSVTNISSAFRLCINLTSVAMSNSIRTMNRAFQGCSSLTSIVIPTSVTAMDNAFDECTILNKRGLITENWLRRRFINKPIHKECYDVELTPAALSSSILKNHDTLDFVDDIGMTALHILCCNPNVTLDMIQILKASTVDSVSVTNVAGFTPLMLYLKCKDMKEYQPENMNMILGLGPTCDEIECILTLMTEKDQSRVLFDLEIQNEVGLYPFMVASSLSQCGLDSVYSLALKRPELLKNI